MYNGFLLIFILFLFILILIQRIRIDHLLDDEEDCFVPDTEMEIAVMSAEGELEKESETENFVSMEETKDLQEETKTAVNGKGGSLQEKLEEEVAAAAAKEIGAGAGKAAIQAQCVIARTALYDAQKNGTKAPEQISRSMMQDLWGEDWEKTFQLYEECAEETRGEILTYKGNYIYAAYHAISAGATRNMAEFYQEADMPYLTEVSCSADAAAKGYLSVLYWEKSEFFDKCSQLTDNSEINDMSMIQVTARDSADYVLTVQIGNDTYSGEEFRSAFSLNSACFTITELDENVRIVTKGVGHGFGMSQNTANQMALGGSSYQDILTAFFKDADLEKLE